MLGTSVEATPKPTKAPKQTAAPEVKGVNTKQTNFKNVALIIAGLLILIISIYFLSKRSKKHTKF